MRFPIQLLFSVTKHMIKSKLKGRKRFPLVLMLEPLHTCNLACDGCGRIREYKETIRDQMSLEDCFKAIDSCDAPIVSVCGGEPLIYPHIVELVNGIVERKRHLYLCTNAIGLEKFLPRFPKSPYFTINVSMDGLEQTHDMTRGRKGLYKIDMASIKAAKAQGFRVVTNTTVYKETQMDEIEGLCEELKAAGTDGMLIAPGYAYQAIQDDIFLDRQGIYEKFRRLSGWSKRFRFMNTPLYLEFLRGERHFDCTPWGNPTVNPKGWKGPCYLITDTHYQSYDELMAKTDWEKYERRDDPRCANCMMHCSVEPTVMRESGKRVRDVVTMLRWNLS
jgi:hopanoid biosynthesis associated radical SAM protein HpnH